MYFNPEGIGADARGQLWVAEEDDSPKRQSMWNTKTGAFIKDFFGAAKYAPMMAPGRICGPTEVYLHNLRASRSIMQPESGAPTARSTATAFCPMVRRSPAQL